MFQVPFMRTAIVSDCKGAGDGEEWVDLKKPLATSPGPLELSLVGRQLKQRTSWLSPHLAPFLSYE